MQYVLPAEVRPISKICRSGKMKRNRTNYTEEQLSEMDKCFKNTRFLTRPSRIEMAKRLGIKEYQVSKWFQNIRVEAKRMNGARREIEKNSIQRNKQNYADLCAELMKYPYQYEAVPQIPKTSYTQEIDQHYSSIEWDNGFHC